MSYYIGLMSGTSLDAIDAALVWIDKDDIQTLETLNYPLPENLRQSLLTLINPKTDSVKLLGELDYKLGHLFADAVITLLKKTNIAANAIKAIGSHGQTIRHEPNLKTPFTLQIGDPHIIAYRTGITTIADFRRKDMAAGGQGAPLVPAFHAKIFDVSPPKVILNIGGIANITYLSDDKIFGFDTGPGNVLLDSWIYQHLSKKFDENGQWASHGELKTPLLDALLADPYFTQPPPKSTGRELFHLHWLETVVKDLAQYRPQDIQHTLLHLTAKSIADAINDYCNDTSEIIVCGGGVHNSALLSLIQHYSNKKTHSSFQYNINPDFVEATAFAWFAQQRLEGHALDLKDVTGAKNSVVLGAIIAA